MNIVQQTPTKLTIKHFPVFMWGYLGVVYGAFILSGVPIFVRTLSTFQVSSLNCQRVESTHQGNCQLIRSDLFKSQVREISLNTLNEAKFKSRTITWGRPDKRVRKTEREVVILTKTGEAIILPSGSEVHASEINAFIRNPNQKSLQGKKVDHWFINEFFGNLIANFFFVRVGLIF